MAVGMAIDSVVNVSVCTYRWPLNFTEDAYEFLQQDLHQIEDNWFVKVEGYDEKVPVNQIDIDDWYRDDWKETMASILWNTIKTINWQPLKEIFKKYWITIKWVEFRTPKEYNFNTDHLDLMIETDGKRREDDFYDLIPLVEDYLQNVRKRSCDGYMSFEPRTLEEVEKDDYAFIRAMLKHEGIFDFIQENLLEAVYDVIDSEFEMIDYCYKYNGKKYKIDFQNNSLYLIDEKDAN